MCNTSERVAVTEEDGMSQERSENKAVVHRLGPLKG